MDIDIQNIANGNATLYKTLKIMKKYKTFGKTLEYAMRMRIQRKPWKSWRDIKNFSELENIRSEKGKICN